MSKKLTYEYVKNFINSTGYTLLSDNYVNKKTKLSIRCPEDHVYMVKWNNFQQGQRCPICSVKIVAESKRYNINYVRDFVDSTGYTLLSDTYSNSRTKLLIRCDKEHEYSATFNHFQKGQRCPICSLKIVGGKLKHSYDYIKSYIENVKGYTLISSTYENKRTKLSIVCDNNHTFDMRFNNFQQGQRCPICAIERVATSSRLLFNSVKAFIEDEGYALLSNSYVNNHTKLLLRCPEGHEYSVAFNSFQQGTRCPECAGTISKGERELSQFVESFGISIVKNDRTQIVNPKTGYNLELDIWIPSMNKAIEYNGLYWHSLVGRESNDKTKAKQCRQLGIDLLIVSDEQWNNYKEMEMKRIEQWLLK